MEFSPRPQPMSKIAPRRAPYAASSLMRGCASLISHGTPAAGAPSNMGLPL
ncbi:Uncharacterised protein [Mycobacteroides abscessus subsp. abscessus]|nr:Uncharacterised protein [Mycobacteroides abscessus subsp. abscessus]